jgi:spore germination cell wall hydrolase CwlJ-like protein
MSTLLSTAQAQQSIFDNDAIRAIVGEAAGEGYRGMLAVACGIRNRGSLRGVYGLRARHVDREPARIWFEARQAWQESRARDIVGGAGSWESVDFKRPAWARGMRITVRIGKHIFYKKD